jgi:outer membrane protein assembly factor BamB/Flp pilus assembly protein TadD
MTFGYGRAQDTKPESEPEPTPETEAASSPSAVSVAVAAFNNDAVALSGLEPLCVGGTPQTLAARLRLVYMLNVRDAAKTYEAFAAQNSGSAKVPTEDVAAQRKACEAVDAQYLIVGSYKEPQSATVTPETSLKISVAIFGRETGRREDVGTMEGALKDLPRLHADLTGKVLEKLRAYGVPVRTSEWFEATREDTAPFEAYLLHAEGNTLFLQKKWAEAEQKFREAHQKSGGTWEVALSSFERAGRLRLEELEKSGMDAQAEIQKSDEELKAMAAQNQTSGALTLAAREMWKASRLRKKGGAESAKAYAAAIAHYQSFLAKGSAQTVKWKVKLRAPSLPFTLDLRPTVVNDVVYIGSLDGYFYAFDAQTGTRRWRYRIGQPCRTTPAVENGIVYVGCDDSALYALDAASGQLKWKFEAKAAVWSAPTVANGLVFFGCNDRSLYGVDAATGQLKWQLETQAPIIASPRVANNVVYVGSRDNRMYAVDAASGQVKWRLPTAGNIFSTAAIEKGVVYFGSNDGQAYAVDAEKGSVKWKAALGSFAQGTPFVVDGAVYVGAAKALYALNAETGGVQWKVTAQTIPAPVVQGGVMFVTLSDENVYALDAKTGQLRWRFPTDAGIPTSPRVMEKSLIVASSQNLYALSLPDTTSRLTPLLEEEALFQMGSAYHEMGDDAKARDTLKQLFERHPLYSPDAYELFADSAQRLNQPHEEVAARLTALNLQSTESSPSAKVFERLHQVSGLRWTFHMKGRAYWQSVVDGDTIYVGCNDRHVYAMNVNTGQQKWKTSIGAPAWFAPRVSEKFVYVVNTQGSVYALDKTNGAARWSATTVAGLPGGPPVVVNNQIIIGAAGGVLFAMDALTGRRGWSAQVGTFISSPCAANDMLYLTARDGNLYAFDPRALDVKWKLNVGPSLQTPVHEEGTLYVASQNLSAVDAATGQTKWQFKPDPPGCSAPIVASSLVYCGANNGYVYAVDKTSGQEKWRFLTLSGGAPPQVTVADGTLYANTVSGQVYALDLNTGALQWKSQMQGRLLSSPTVGGGKLFAACEDGNLYAVDIAQAAQLRAQGKRWWKEIWSDEVAQAVLASDAAQKKRHLQRAAELAEDSFPVHFQIGWHACDLQAYDVARGQAATLAKLDAENSDVPWLLARIEKEEKNYAEAEKHLREVVRLLPRFLKGYVELETVMEAQGKTFVPAEVLPKDATVIAALAEHYTQKEQFEKAVTEYQRALALNDQNAVVYNNLAWIYATSKNEKLRNPKEALRLARRAIELAPRSAAILDTLAEVYYANKLYDSAIDTINQAIALDRANAYYRSQLAKFRRAKQGR